MPQLPEFTPILPELVVVCLAMILLIYGVFRGDGETRNISWIVCLGCGVNSRISKQTATSNDSLDMGRGTAQPLTH